MQKMRNSFKFIHAADIHIDGALSVASLYDMPLHMREVIEKASRKAFSNLVELALSSEVDFIVISGDLFDYPERGLSSQLFIRDEFKKLLDAGIYVYISAGNHDHYRAEFPHIDWPDNVFWFDSTNVLEYDFSKDGVDLARVFGVSFFRRAEIDNLSQKFREIPRSLGDDIFNIGVLHTNLQGSVGHLNYAPCTRQDLCECNIDYWALGHVHTRLEIKGKDPAIIYPGCIQGRGFYEQGQKGCYIVSVSCGKLDTMEHVALDSVRFKDIDVDISDVFSLDELIQSIKGAVVGSLDAKIDMLVAKVFLRNKCNIALSESDFDDILQETRQLIQRETMDRVHIYSISNEAVYYVNEIDMKHGIIGEFTSAIDKMLEDEDSLKETLDILFEDRNISKNLGEFTESERKEILKMAKSLGIKLILSEGSELGK